MAVLQVDPSRVITIDAKTLEEVQAQRRNLRVCAYARVSTDEEEQMTSYHSQIAHYTDKIKSQVGWDFVGMFADEGISGTSTKNRKEFLKMIRKCREGKIDRIITKSISRFARNTVDSITYARTLKSYGVSIFFEKENIDTSEMDNEMIFTIMSSFAQGESESMSSNIQMGKRNAYKQGKYSFPNRMYGYELIDKVPTIVENEAAIIRLIFDLFIKGNTLRKICDDLIQKKVDTPFDKKLSLLENFKDYKTVGLTPNYIDVT